MSLPVFKFYSLKFYIVSLVKCMVCSVYDVFPCKMRKKNIEMHVYLMEHGSQNNCTLVYAPTHKTEQFFFFSFIRNNKFTARCLSSSKQSNFKRNKNAHSNIYREQQRNREEWNLNNRKLKGNCIIQLQ